MNYEVYYPECYSEPNEFQQVFGINRKEKFLDEEKDIYGNPTLKQNFLI
jgi:hypothetical protein